MTSQALLILIAASLLKGAVFGAAFAWIFLRRIATSWAGWARVRAPSRT